LSTIQTAQLILLLLEYEDGEKAYILAPSGLKVGDNSLAGKSQILSPETHFRLQIPTGTFIHNVELYPGRGGQLARAAGECSTA
jgi:large subunit ribosomal protein L2